jgi:hypothetical protein
MLHQVLRKFRAEGVDRKSGEIVETSSWKNERLLLEHRFIGKPSVPQKDATSLVEGANVASVAEPESSGAISKPEPPKATPTEKLAAPPETAVKPVTSVKPAVLRKWVAVVGKVPVARAAK